MEVHAVPADGFVLTIEDNGQAFTPRNDRNDSGRGLANMRARASLIGAEMSWSKSMDGGTLFTLRLPAATKRSS